MLTKKEQKALVQLAKNSLEYYLKHKKFYNAKEFVKSQLTLQEIKNVSVPAGVFVTLKKNNHLKGCIGLIESNKPLFENVNKYAVNAGLHDGRFSSVTEEEVSDITAEISVLTKPKKINSPDEIEIGKHGVILTNKKAKAVFLPQVASEWGWNTRQLLEHLSEKAGLPTDAYLDKNTILEVFEAQVFEEEGSDVKKAEFAGSFYPNYSDKLDQMLDYFIFKADNEDYKTRAIISPHAGYLYSGKTAGAVYKILGKNINLKTIVIFSPSHNFHIKDVIASSYRKFETPLGQIEVDVENLKKVQNLKTVSIDNDAFYEHSLEVHLPFIQKTFDDKIKILPFIVGETKPETVADIIKIFWKDKSVGFVFSTDLSHYLSKKECKKIDDKTINFIENLEYEKLHHEMLCGYNPVSGIMKFAQDNNFKIVNVSRSDSSEYSGDDKQVVGYAGFIIIED